MSAISVSARREPRPPRHAQRSMTLHIDPPRGHTRLGCGSALGRGTAVAGAVTTPSHQMGIRPACLIACHPNAAAPSDVFTVPMKRSHSSIVPVPRADWARHRPGPSAGRHSMTKPTRQNPIAFGHFMTEKNLGTWVAQTHASKVEIGVFLVESSLFPRPDNSPETRRVPWGVTLMEF